MALNWPYGGPQDLPTRIPVFPLTGAILLPRGQLPLNIFEPRYLAMIDDALATHRLIGMIQPDASKPACARGPGLFSIGCVGRLTQIAETGDGRYLITLTGVARFALSGEAEVATAYRQCDVAYEPFAADFAPTPDEAGRAGVLDALRRFARARRICIDWSGVNETTTETLDNALAMMSPFGAGEKQALLEAGTVSERAGMLIAMTDMDLAAGGGAGKSSLQ